jgi:hypothetical protein
MFKKKNFAAKTWLKYTDRPKYKEYKWNLANYHLIERTEAFNFGDQLNTLHKIREHCSKHDHVNFMHSGNAGDIIYALPSLKRIFELTGTRINLYLKLNQPLELHPGTTHPLGAVMLNQKMADMLFPLIRAQEYIHSCEVSSNEQIHIDLDNFRRLAIPLDKGNIARWCSYVTGVTPELYQSWLSVEPDNAYAETIVLARSERYHNSFVDHSFLSQYNNLVFVGVASEYDNIKKYVPNIKWVQVKDFMELARIIAGCKLFIGNQSFPYSIAEGLKVPRIMETCYRVTNVVPEGKNAHEFYFQEHFESLVRELNSNH